MGREQLHVQLCPDKHKKSKKILPAPWKVPQDPPSPCSSTEEEQAGIEGPHMKHSPGEGRECPNQKIIRYGKNHHNNNVSGSLGQHQSPAQPGGDPGAGGGWQ